MIASPYPDRRLSGPWRVKRAQVQHAWVEPVFRTDLAPSGRDAAPFRTTRPFAYRITLKDGTVLAGAVPKDLLTDGASVPRALRWYADDDSGRHLGPAMLHDWMFLAWQRLPPATDTRQRQRFAFANAVFQHTLRAAGVRWGKAWIMWGAVRWKGWKWYIKPDGDLFA